MVEGTKPEKDTIARALLGIYEAQDIMREDQKLFYRTLSDLKTRADSSSKGKPDSSKCPAGENIHRS